MTPDLLSIATRAVNDYGALHDVDELAALLAIADQLAPCMVVEIGTWAGGGAWALAELASVVRVITIDPAPQPQASTAIAASRTPIFQVRGMSGDPAVYWTVQHTLGNQPVDLLLIDGAHDYDTASDDWNRWHGLVGRGGLVVLHDTQGWPGRPDIAVPRLWGELRPGRRTLELVSHPGGPFGTGLIWM